MKFFYLDDLHVRMCNDRWPQPVLFMDSDERRVAKQSNYHFLYSAGPRRFSRLSTESEAGVAESADALGLGPSAARRGGSSPSTRTITPNLVQSMDAEHLRKMGRDTLMSPVTKGVTLGHLEVTCSGQGVGKSTLFREQVL